MGQVVAFVPLSAPPSRVGGRFSHTRAAEDEVLIELRALRTEVAEIRKAQGDAEPVAAPEG
jgi:hypothetical protein